LEAGGEERPVPVRRNRLSTSGSDAAISPVHDRGQSIDCSPKRLLAARRRIPRKPSNGNSGSVRSEARAPPPSCLTGAAGDTSPSGTGSAAC